jgi:5'-nucleotidase
MEAAVYGIPALAASQDEVADARGELAYAAEVVAGLSRRILTHGLPRNTFLNVNFPALPPAQVRGIQVTRLGKRVYRDVLIRRLDPKGRPYYWIGGDPPGGEPDDGTDIGAIVSGFVSVTPLNLDMTDRALMARLPDWCHDL